MVEFIFGSSAKERRRIHFQKINEALKEGRRAYMIVPEQQVLAYEDEASRFLPPSAPLTFTVASFSLLANITARRFGALSYKQLSRSQKIAYTWKALRESAPFLSLYSSSSPEALCTRMLECIDELKASGISADDLTEASELIPDSTAFSKKLSDVATVFSAYKSLIADKYSDINDELQKLNNLLKKEPFFEGCDIFIDSFTDFTPVQLRILQSIITTARSVRISFPADPVTDRSPQFECIRNTYKDICDVCDLHGVKYSVSSLSKSNCSDVLEYISGELFSASPSIPELSDKEKSRIKIYSCSDPQDEVCACINLIRKEVYEGNSYKDIAVISRSPKKYERLLSLAAADADIPLFTSDRFLLSDSVFAVYLISLLKVICGGWKREDVIVHLKSGLTGADFNDVSRFDLYTQRWDMSGREKLCSSDFSAPYRGFSRQRDGDEVFTESALRIKNEVFPQILKLEEELRKARTITEMLKALFSHAESSGVPQRLEDISKKLADNGNISASSHNARAYAAIINLFDDLAYSLGEDNAISLRELCDLIELTLSGAEIGGIPSRQDEVVLADASMYRSFGHKTIIMLGMNEGEFPAPPSIGGIINDSEKELLRKEGLRFASSALLFASKEYLFLWRALSMASEKLYLLYHEKDSSGEACIPNVAIRNITSLIPGISSERFNDHVEELTYDPMSIVSKLSSDGISDALYDTIVRYCTERLSDTEKLSRTRGSLSNGSGVACESISDVLTYPLFISPTSLEKYNKCAFAYFCSEYLELDDGKKNEFSAAVLGTIVHEILESYIQNYSKSSDIPARGACLSIAEEYYDRICPEYMRDDERFKLNFKRAALNASVLADYVMKDLDATEFTPAEFEKALSLRLVSNGGEIVINGRADRIDLASSEGDNYARVIDYKTGSQTFSLADMDDGTMLQLPLYLYSTTEGGSRLPGGFLYLSSAVPPHSITKASELEDDTLIRAKLASGVSASGIMNSLFAKRSNMKLQAMANEKIDEILKCAVSVAYGSVERIQKGDFSADPKIINQRYPCEYCSFAAVCRSKKEAKK